MWWMEYCLGLTVVYQFSSRLPRYIGLGVSTKAASDITSYKRWRRESGLIACAGGVRFFAFLLLICIGGGNQLFTCCFVIRTAGTFWGRPCLRVFCVSISTPGPCFGFPIIVAILAFVVWNGLLLESPRLDGISISKTPKKTCRKDIEMIFCLTCCGDGQLFVVAIRMGETLAFVWRRSYVVLRIIDIDINTRPLLWCVVWSPRG